MKSIRYHIVITLVLSLMPGVRSALQAQDTTRAAIQVLTTSTEDGVIIRWAPDTPVAWQLGNQFGYQLIRYTLSTTDSSGYSEKTVLRSDGHYVLPESQWASVAQDNKWGAIAAQALYGDDFTLTDPGASAAALLNEAEELDNRFSFALLAADLSAPVADAMALRWVDRGAQKGRTYVYRVALQHQLDEYPVAHGSSKIVYGTPRTLPVPEGVKATFSDHSLSLSWETFYLDGIYSSYVVERSDDGGNTFRPVDDLAFFSLKKEGNGPLERMYYLDSLPDNQKEYQFRVYGITPFGQSGPPSEAISGQGYVSLGDALPVIEDTRIDAQGHVWINWRFNATLISQVQYFSLERAPKAGGPYTVVQPEIAASALQTMDASPAPVNYYVVKAYGRHGEVRQSFPAMFQLEDSIPPRVPVGLTGQIDQKGRVALSWDPVPDTDLYGYRVFRKNSVGEAYIQVTTEALHEPSFRDSVTLETLTEEVYYAVTAQDRRYNQSDYSIDLVLKKPDIIPPVSPVLTKVEGITGGVFISWQPMRGGDLSYLELHRKPTGGNTWRVFRISMDSTIYKDQVPGTATGYTYRLIAIDDDGLKSAPVEFTARPLTGKIAPLTEVDYQADREKKQISWRWQYTSGYREIIVYRSARGSALRRYAVVESGIDRFTDRDVMAGGQYTYRFKVVKASGAESPVSQAWTIDY